MASEWLLRALALPLDYESLEAQIPRGLVSFTKEVANAFALLFGSGSLGAESPELDE
jgi:hypothetical protein